MVDVLLRGGSNGQTIFVGSVATDARGAFDGKLVLQHELQLGDYELILSTDGDARCGIGTAQ
jgi:5-hydroxyisourate hydrolase-like protein (transthyretin family)